MNFQWAIPTIDKKTRGFSRFRLVILGVLAAFLMCAVITRGLASYLAESNHGASLRLRAGNPTALLSLIETTLDEAQEQASKESSQQGNDSSSFYPAGLDAKDAAQIRRWAETVLRNDPLNSEALRLLGQ